MLTVFVLFCLFDMKAPAPERFLSARSTEWCGAFRATIRQDPAPPSNCTRIAVVKSTKFTVAVPKP